jgi:hypothetical protein
MNVGAHRARPRRRPVPPGPGASTSRRRGTRGPAFSSVRILGNRISRIRFPRTRFQGFEIKDSIPRIRSPIFRSQGFDLRKFDLKDSSLTARSSRPLIPPRRPAPRTPRGRRRPGPHAATRGAAQARRRVPSTAKTRWAAAAGVRRIRYPLRAPGRYGRTGVFAISVIFPVSDFLRTRPYVLDMF